MGRRLGLPRGFEAWGVSGMMADVRGEHYPPGLAAYCRRASMGLYFVCGIVTRGAEGIPGEMKASFAPRIRRRVVG